MATTTHASTRRKLPPRRTGRLPAVRQPHLRLAARLARARLRRALPADVARSRCRASPPSWKSGTIASSSDLDKAAKLKAETDAAIAAYEKALADAKAKAQAIAAETRDKLAAETDARRKALEADLTAKLAAAEAQIVDGKTKAMQNVRGIAVDAAAAIVERLMGTAPAVEARSRRPSGSRCRRDTAEDDHVLRS